MAKYVVIDGCVHYFDELKVHDDCLNDFQEFVELPRFAIMAAARTFYSIGQKIEAIKPVRVAFNMGFKEAKDFVESDRFANYVQFEDTSYHTWQAQREAERRNA